ncbi:GNAT family N-acetyltransferase [uncultured Tateyamaria sp.]|uniref:GNAT family N-acetyltransferase n=1 Tax=uncultured Tateyamaria sp. TaxID=455651 RepID=UPI002614AB45|nr:GNAT family N-acetyltransferase [uncultured Tateyamaria sp.]
MTFIIREAKPADRLAPAVLHAASWRSAYAPFVPPEALGAPLDANMEARWGTWPADRLILLAERAGAVVGFAAVVPGDVPLMDNLHVDPRIRGGGIGQKLFAAMVKRLHTDGAQALRLEVLEGNTGARRFYRLLGGVEGASHTDILLGHSVAMLPVQWSAPAFAALVQEFAVAAGKDA